MRQRFVMVLLSAGLWHSVPMLACAFLIVTGTYTGNGVDNRDITVSPSFAISLVLLKANAVNVAVFSHTGMGADTTAFTNVNTAFSTDCIQSIGSGTFQVGTNAACNANETTYYYVAFGQDGRNDLAIGTYTGSSVTADNRNISISPSFQPHFCTLSGNNTGTGSRPWLVPNMGADNACAWNNATCSSNRIQQFNADGFQIGSNSAVNTNAITYTYFCFRSGTPATAVGNYTGDGVVDPRTFSGLGFTPLFAMIKRDSTDPAAFRFGSQIGDSAFVGGTTAAANIIESFTDGAFTVGTNAATNVAGGTYYYFAIGAQPALKRAGGPVWLD